MRTPLTILTTCLAATLLFVVGCVELTGQRISIAYDEATDELRLMLFYDGVHDTGGDQKGADQIAEFIEDGQVMLMDWPFRLQPSEIREALADDTDLPSAVRDLAEAVLESIHVEPIGRYRDVSGRMGAAQRVTITNASRLVEQANAVISYAILENGESGGPDGLPRTFTMMRAAAQADHQWLAIEGHSLRWSMPVHRHEWAVAKAWFLREMFTEFGDFDEPRADDDGKAWERALERRVGAAAQLLTSAPVSYSEAAGHVTLRLGDPAEPSVLRVRIRDAYEPNLEGALITHVPEDIDVTIASRLMRGVAAPRMDAIIALGPPEQQAAALWHAAHTDDTNARAAAIARLQTWALQWNDRYGIPEAPAELAAAADATDDSDPTVGYLQQWQDWLEAMQRFPE